MYIFQPYRFLTREMIKEHSKYIRGIVLDAGCGGYLRYKYFFNCDKYLTLDINAKTNPDIVGSVEKIPLSDSSVDSIICTGVLGDIFEPAKAIREFHRVLKGDGCCLLTEAFFGFISNRPYDYFRFTNYFLEKIFKENGFEIIHCKKIGGFFSLLAQAKINYLILKFNLHRHKFIGRIFSKLFSFYSYLMIFLDKIDKSQAGKDCAISWMIIAKKVKGAK